ncbi:predicted protein [Naegleria gruberi]|uniref:Predicted protein n=1 Tax=Naegleria gruberi TaxID=5762 RepID=D2UZ49_NAEGR|nr:uncharacterized protein NAEGRDRAFT_61812 [Naegleria gruberi]EFC49881.1 predicted protein [Naegleria gruberi]|eukprot:XP_002682625.1 predicted protein [Naegleria gruberi strain NEG-M]
MFLTGKKNILGSPKATTNTPPLSSATKPELPDFQLDDIFTVEEYDAFYYITSRKLFGSSPSSSSTGSLNGEQQFREEKVDLSLSFIRNVDLDILIAYREACSSSSTMRKELEDAMEMLFILNEKMTYLKSLSEKAEQARETRALEIGKRNLIQTIMILKRLNSFTTIIEKMKIQASKKQYKQVTEFLIVSNELKQSLEEFKTVPKAQLIFKRFDNFRQSLQGILLKDCKELGSKKDENLQGILSEMCPIVDALEDDVVRIELVSKFAALQLSTYESQFKDRKLESIDDRFKFIKQLLKNFEEEYDHIFPHDWCVPQELVVEFSLKTRESILLWLKKDSSISGKLLYLAILSTMKFERNMQSRFYPEKSPVQPAAHNEDEVEIKTPKNKYNFRGFISSCFEDHMHVYIKFEEDAMKEILAKIVKKETWDNVNQASSCQDVLIYVIESMKSCSAVSSGKTLNDVLQSVFRKCLMSYADILIQKLPKVQNTTPTEQKSVTSTITGYVGMTTKLGLSAVLPTDTITTEKKRLTEKEEKIIFYIIHCADYIQQNTQPLEEELRGLLQEPYSAQIDLSQEQEKFLGIVKSGIEMLVNNLMNVLEKPLSEMLAKNWGIMESVGDQSGYVSNIVQNLNDIAPYIANSLSLDNFKFLCDRFTITFITTFLSNIYKCKKFSRVGAHQMLVDVKSLTQYSLRRLLVLGNDKRFEQSDISSFQKLVDSKMQKIEITLRALAAVPDNTYEIYLQMPEHSLQELTKLLEMKEISRSERNHILDRYQKEAVKKEETKDASYLSMIGTGSAKVGKATVQATSAATSAIFSAGKSVINKSMSIIK